MLDLLSKMRLPVLLAGMSLMFSGFFYLFLITEKTLILEFSIFCISTSSFSFAIILDKISLSFGMVVTLISACVFTFACKYMEEDVFFFRFIWVLMAFVISMNLLIFSGSIFFLLLGWDGLGITSFALIVYYQSFESLSAGFQTLMANRVGDAIIVTSMFLFASFGQFSFVSLGKEMWVLVLMLCVAALTKSAQYPFCSWLPAAMAAPTPVSALVHSSTLVTAGIFVVIRLSYNLPLSEAGCSMLLFCGSVTCLLGGWAATFENDIKKIIALSTLSQLGVMVFSLGLGLPALALFHLYTHALFKAMLFLAAGAILMLGFGAQDIRLLGGVGLKMPLAMVLFNVSSLCLIGAPFLSAFYSKHLILEKMFFSGTNMFSIFLMLLATMMTAKYVSRSLKAIIWGKPVAVATMPPMSMLISIPLVTLGLGAISGGKFFSSLDVSNLEVAFLPSLLSSVINLVTILGLVLGTGFVFGLRKSHGLSSLFFLTPVFSLGSKAISPFMRKLNSLDYGWIEPSFLVKGPLLDSVGWWSARLLSWPSSYSSLMRLGAATVFFFIALTLVF
uniref:NADH-ubiquinone oxidoreductase chain 5 n=1 Tax=Trimusculus reticulatus TaxID=981059 RepID=G8HTF4_9EUPU|nr:NADH dehydrogenase subunit 5 [Trimusculus reticulatus]AEQ93933.1 NADH dehydrogenase subunit 5 [Trimusculus reticulatus]